MPLIYDLRLEVTLGERAQIMLKNGSLDSPQKINGKKTYCSNEHLQYIDTLVYITFDCQKMATNGYTALNGTEKVWKEYRSIKVNVCNQMVRVSASQIEGVR